MFYTYSGLQLNCDKSEFYCSGVSRDTVNEMQLSTGFKCGSLPVRYLGVPLVTRRLSFKDCYPLFNKMKARINCWSARLISYARRLQLIKSVLYSIQNFWCRHFILPKGVLKKINQLCLDFFWKRREQPAKGARISWDTICYPKSEGGLGLKELVSWNKACRLQSIWAIITKSGSLWIAWIQEYVLKGKSFWDLAESSTSSWSRRNY